MRLHRPFGQSDEGSDASIQPDLQRGDGDAAGPGALTTLQEFAPAGAFFSSGNQAAWALSTAKFLEAAAAPGLLASATTGTSPVSDSVDSVLNGPIARATFGVDGTGIKIGIISSSFDELNGGGNAATDETDGALPTANHVHILQDAPSGATNVNDEGRAMAEIVHSIAPGADIYFYSGDGGQSNMAAAITALKQAGCQIIVDDLFYFAEPFYQSGSIIDQAIDAAAASGTTYFTLAGNSSDVFYEHSFQGFATTVPIGLGGASAPVTAYNFGTAANPSAYEKITLPTSTKSEFIDLQWDQPFAIIGSGQSSANTLSIYLFQDIGTSRVLVASSTFNQIGWDPVQYIQYTNNSSNTQFELAVTLDGGPAPGRFKIVVGGHGGPAHFNDPNAGTGTGTVFGHEMDPNAITVGAAPYYIPTSAESFSSIGPGEFLFDSNGNRLASPVSANKVDITAPDGNSTTVSDIANFFGTSAAGPAAAAVGGLMLQANPALNPADIAHLLEDSATAMPSPLVTGAGLVNAGAAVTMAKTLSISIVVSETKVQGTHLNDTFFGGAGSHTIDGGGGIDTILYQAAPAAVAVDIGDGVAHNGFGGTDSFTNVQNFGGTSFNDVFAAAAGNHAINGDGGHDTLVFHGAAAGYGIANTGNDLIAVTDQSGTRDGTTNAFGIEVLQFTDKTIFVEQQGISDIAALYSAALGRAPDAAGLIAWEDVYNQSVTATAKQEGRFVALAETDPTGLFTSIAGGFTGSTEFQQKYGALSDSDFVTLLYHNVLDRTPDQAGLNSWLGAMHNADPSGHVFTREMVLVGFAASPENYAKISADWLHLV